MLLSPGTRGDAHCRDGPACVQAPVCGAATGAQVQRGPHAAGVGAQPGPRGAAGAALAGLLPQKSPSCGRGAMTCSARVAGRAGVLQAAAQPAGEQAAGRRCAGAALPFMAAVACTLLTEAACAGGPACFHKGIWGGRACAAWCPHCSAAATSTRRSAWCALAPGSCAFQGWAWLSAVCDPCARAQACQQRSEGSRRITHFYELDVQVKGMATLEHSLVRPPV